MHLQDALSNLKMKRSDSLAHQVVILQGLLERSAMASATVSGQQAKLHLFQSMLASY